MERSKDGSRHVTDERINVITSMVGAMLSVLFGGILLASVFEADSQWYQRAAVVLYVFGLCNMYIMSTLHHVLNVSPRTESVFRTLDYTAIFIVIASTLTAVVSYSFADTYGLAVILGTWLIAAAGIALRSSIPNLPKYITSTMFITLGWLPPLALLIRGSTLSASELALLAIGGLFYSIGFYIYVRERPNFLPGRFGFHELWHIMVIIASVFHWMLIYQLAVQS
jgi:hemolysin III